MGMLYRSRASRLLPPLGKTLGGEASGYPLSRLVHFWEPDFFDFNKGKELHQELLALLRYIFLSPVNNLKI